MSDDPAFPDPEDEDLGDTTVDVAEPAFPDPEILDSDDLENELPTGAFPEPEAPDVEAVDRPEPNVAPKPKVKKDQGVGVSKPATIPGEE